MLFNSIEFLFFFLPLFGFLYFVTKGSNFVFIFLSLLFYAYGEGSLVVLLILLVFVNYLFGNLIKFSNENLKSFCLLIGIGINLLTLFYFKYFDLFIDLINFVLYSINVNFLHQNIHLPIGVSFIVFQCISYIVDVYRDQNKVCGNFSNLLLYISMFPHQLAGPIVRYVDVAIKLDSRNLLINNVIVGFSIFSYGLAMKCLIADFMAPTVDYVFEIPIDKLNFTYAWVGAISYSFQIYFDFYGYSLMATGLALSFGIFFPKNFNYPYCALSVTDFWRKWHISLSIWFRDYLYIPLGGDRRGSYITYRNLFLVFILCGLWHGSKITFIVWGLYHGFLLTVERMCRSKSIFYIPKSLKIALTFLLVTIGWIIFRSPDLTYSIKYIARMFSLDTVDYISSYNIGLITKPSWILSATIAALTSFGYFGNTFPQFKFWPRSDEQVSIFLYSNNFLFFIFAFALFSISCIHVMSSTYSPFIYFRF
jgi:alginate O-acetyltransferase complex protein AlgI